MDTLLLIQSFLYAVAILIVFALIIAGLILIESLNLSGEAMVIVLIIFILAFITIQFYLIGTHAAVF